MRHRDIVYDEALGQMNILMIYAHPDNDSYVSALHREAIHGLRDAGHCVDNCDLYAENFNPVMSHEERVRYYRIPDNRDRIKCYVERLERADAIIIISPVWTLGFPAILKGYFDRVWVPGVAFNLSDGKLKRRLVNIKKGAVITTYGMSLVSAMLAGDPPRRVITSVLRSQIRQFAPVSYYAHYGMDRASVGSRGAFLEKVRRRMQGF